MMSTIGARVEVSARYHGGAYLGSHMGRQAPPVCLGSERFKQAYLLRSMSPELAHHDRYCAGTKCRPSADCRSDGRCRTAKRVGQGQMTRWHGVARESV